MSAPKLQCQVCGVLESPEVIEAMVGHGFEYWTVHQIERKGGIIQVLTCPNCNTATQDLILQTYQERIRQGLILGFH